jgi:hypothetical protein
METTHEPLYLDKWRSDSGIPISCIWIITLFNEAFKFGNDAKFLGYIGARFNHSV